MLEVKNLTKIYRSKTGESVKALDNVSISFPETGMIFILGKSGSGKSTLLNVMGGLDAYDDGEFIIKGKSSKDFASSDFDAYRNTFIGFIFQEYNVLDDFTVGANIGLALELQGKKATDEKINEILDQVDLLNYAKRKPNELSGGQKQRVAIARALVKEPQIIMADEPTGALDSNTGKQIFDTLKELSKEKLVLIVSHDRDFAERYADRIVELSDGKILSDVTKHEKQSVHLSEGIQQINDRLLRIKGGYRLTQNDLQMINDYLQQNNHDIILSGDVRINDELRSAAGISAEGNTSVFEETNGERDVKLRSYEKKESQFIRSKLPVKNALRIGASGLKHKKFRLVMTIFLSLLAFALFGFADTLGVYEKHNAAVASVIDSEIKNASVRLGVKHTVSYDDEEPWSYHAYAPMNDEDIEFLREQTGLDFVPVFTGGDEWSGGFSIAQQFKAFNQNSEVYKGKLAGLVAMSDDQIANAELTLLSGRLPNASGEIAITELALRQFNEYGFVNAELDEELTAGSVTAEKLLGKHITLYSNYGMSGENAPSFKIVGVIDTGFDYDRYESLLPSDDAHSQNKNDNSLATMVLTNELRSELSYGFHMLGFAHEDDIETFAELYGTTGGKELGMYMHGLNSELYLTISSNKTAEMTPEQAQRFQELVGSIQHQRIAGSEVLQSLGGSITWFDPNQTTLGEGEIIIPYWMYQQVTSYLNLDFNNLTESQKAEISDLLQSFVFTLVMRNHELNSLTDIEEYDLKIVGYNASEHHGDILICNEIKNDYLAWYEEEAEKQDYHYSETVAEHEDGIWGFAIAPMGDAEALRKLVQMTYDENGDLNFSLQNSVMNTLDSFNDFIEVGAQVFLYVGIGFAVFSALLLMNFITISISYKKREIGILRAVGARSSDVFKIFFSEALIIALINFILSLGALIAAVLIANGFMRSQGINITLLNFGPRQVILMLLVSVSVALLATFLPVYRIAKRKPIDAIKDR
ncbi:MAG: ABC transporter ATP-binding protein/permease [Clostridia bacterium]|nr:ABC transporter ATP-binding protein/permease [Clostridia bacterium]